jgi:hypothetical protein
MIASACAACAPRVSPVAGIASGAMRRAVAVRYLAIAAAGNRRQEADFDRPNGPDGQILLLREQTCEMRPTPRACSMSGWPASRFLPGLRPSPGDSEQAT